jgi:PKD repeat protein
VSSPIDFGSINISGDIVSYLWDFGDTNTSTDPSPSYTFAASGDYQIYLTVQSGDGCSNSISKTLTIYNEPAPGFILPVGTICTNEEYTFTNNTIDNFDDNLTYEWQVGGETIGTERELLYKFTSGGAKEVKLITSIPGCSIEQVQSIPDVSEGAIPSFSFDTENTCLGDPISFIDQSVGTDITSYAWDFGDMTTATGMSPMHAYETVGEYMVSLQVTNVSGCITNYQEPITIHSLPVADFTAELACTEQTTLLTDDSNVDNANIELWDWDFGDVSSGGENISSKEAPVHTFPEAGEYNVSLSVTSNFGCEMSVEKLVEVLESPIADFNADIQCLGNLTTFFDESTPNIEGIIESRVWNINGVVYTDVNPSHLFDSPGTYDVSLTIKSDNRCAVSTTRQIVIYELPTADFELSSNCVDTEVSLVDMTSLDDDGDNFFNRQWTINGVSVGNGPTINYTFDESGSYNIALRVITGKGCIVDKSMDIDIYDLPEASFEVSEEYSAVPALIQFENNSLNAMNSKWTFGDGSSVNNETSPSHSYTDLGTYEIMLEVESPEGCFDEQAKQIYVVDPKVDLSIDEITTFNDQKQILFMMSNKGTLPITNVTAKVTFNSELSLEENFTTNILPGQESVARTLNFSIPDNAKIEYMCIELFPSQGGDLNLDDNTQCINIAGNFQTLNPYPSPISRDQTLTIPFIGDKGNAITIGVMNASGKQFLSQEIELAQDGLNNVGVSLFSLKAGIYFIQVLSSESTKSFRIFVN